MYAPIANRRQRRLILQPVISDYNQLSCQTLRWMLKEHKRMLLSNSKLFLFLGAKKEKEIRTTSKLMTVVDKAGCKLGGG